MIKNRKRIVIALGGNALGNNLEEQQRQVEVAADIISNLAIDGHELIIGHGNGPQIGIINFAMNESSNGLNTPYMPFAECGAMSQGLIGYHLQQALQQKLSKLNICKMVISVITQVLVDADDPAFSNPTKPIGNYYTKEEAEKIATKYGFTFTEDAGRGYRRVVPSPRPQRIVELQAIRKMVQSGLLVIAAGGGGIPVVEDKKGLHGIDAVIDKDMSCAKLAIEMKADILLILTAVEHVCINYNKPNQKKLYNLSLKEAKKYLDEGHFAKGSMLPKIDASIRFVEALPGRVAIITSLEKTKEALNGITGTRIESDKQSSIIEDYTKEREE